MPPGLIPTPDYAAWKDAFERSPLRKYLTPKLVVESSRGCCWGEKPH